MLKYMRHQGEKGQIVILLAFAMIGLLGIVGLALDGGMLYWNQRRAQNGADAAVIAGVTAMADHTLLDGGCGPLSEYDIQKLIEEYADVNEVPDAAEGQNIVTYYLVENGSGDRVDLISPSTGEPWFVGETGTIPCDKDPIGLRVEASFPQQTFLAGVIGIAETNVTVEASAIVDDRKGCGDYVLLSVSEQRNKQVLSITGAGSSISGGGVHSNGGMHIGGGGQEIYLECPYPIEYGEGGDYQIGEGKIERGEPCDSEPDLGIGEGDQVDLGDTFYRFEDFLENGTIGGEVVEADVNMYHFVDGDLNKDDVVNADGSWKHGLYVVTGDVQLNSMDKVEDLPWRVTIAAQGTIKISGGFNARPYAHAVLFFTESNDTTNGAIQFSGDSNTWAGMVAAPNGLINISAAKNNDMTGMIIGYEISMSGSDNTYRHHPNTCPPDPPMVRLIQ